MQSKYVIIFVEVLALIGAVAFFAGQHAQHLNAVQDTLKTIKKSVEASEKVLGDLQKQKEAIASARVETDKKLLEVPDGDMCYEYYGRLLREDAERRCGGTYPDKASDGADEPVH